MSDYSDAIDLLEPVHYWRLEGNSNDTGTGTTLNGTDTTMEYDSTLVVTGVSTVASFNLDGYVTIATSTDLDNMITTQRTISVWVRPTLDTLTFNVIRIGTTTSGIYLSLTAGMLPMVGIVTGSTSDVYYGNPVIINEPIHILLEYDSGAVKLWQDGVLTIDETSTRISIPASIGGAGIGSGESVTVDIGTFTEYDLHSKMSNLAIWNSTLTESQKEDIVYGSGITEVVRTAHFFNIPDKTEIRLYDIDDGLAELGGIEFAGGASGDEVDINFTALTELNARVGIVNVEAFLETFYADFVLARTNVDLDVSLLLVDDRNYSNPGGWIQPIPVSNITAPYLTGVAKPGSGLTVNEGVWAGSSPITYEYQWYRTGSTITDETGMTYTVQASDEDKELFCRETASNPVPSSGYSDTGTRTYIDTKIFGIWESTSASAGQTPSVSWVNVEFDNEVVNINSEFGTSDNKTFTMPAGSYLVVATMKYEDSSNGRTCPEGRIVYGGTGGTHGPVYGSGYSRDSNNFTSFIRTMSFMHKVDADDTFTVQHRSDSDLQIGGSVADSCHLQIINIEPFAIGMYDDNSDTAAYGTQVWSGMPFNNEIVEEGASITMSADNTTVTLSANTLYLISYGIAFGVGGLRTQRISKAEINSSDVESSFSYAYIRNSSNEYGDIGSIFIYETGVSDETLVCSAQRGDADVSGSAVRRVSTSSLFIVDLGTAPDFYVSHDGTGGQDVQNNPTINMFETEDNTSPSFTATSDTVLKKVGKQFVLMGASIFANQADTAADVRLSRGLTFTIDSVTQTVGQSGQYLRGNQGTEDTFDIGMGIVGVFEIENGLDIEVDVFATGQDGAADALTAANSCGFWVVDINSI